MVGAIAADGAMGALARYGIEHALPHAPGAFPWSTFTMNVTGCLLIGALMVLIGEVWSPHRLVRPFLGTGVLGGFTTFSTYIVDALRQSGEGAARTAQAYLAATLIERAVQSRHDTLFPWGTFCANATGSLLAATFSADVPESISVLLGTGLCRVLTTYSTFGYETLRLLADRARSIPVLNAAASIFAGLGATLIGYTTTQAILG